MQNRTRVLIMTAVLAIGTAIWLPGVRGLRVAAQDTTLAGSYGFRINFPYTGDASRVGLLQGVVTFDNAGNVTVGGGVNIAIDSDPTAGLPVVRPLQSPPGTYKLNSDGTGTMTFPDPNGNPPTSFSFVVTDGGSQLMLVATSGFGNTVITGTARRQ